ncbi:MULTISPECIES: DUF4097 family beta strand repeat-containing protein [unclassified Streptomyces]|uniref:DUF4097 family beta strand repeat-containing protein n=1 Tax=unclassified Streptomyces TaxID=2593676 RepID=UPI00225A80D9|nr:MULTISPECIES: DUF4097 family beta strand repeat-containing protein [unclassified Streptomyces]MCX5047754.1 DUF4097 domain-containing protein [Streptomyces sp. NBC_00474]MCX5245566.1 DUF4097 domain-containing protein [Streptomyces sp. NBC_00201]
MSRSRLVSLVPSSPRLLAAAAVVSAAVLGASGCQGSALNEGPLKQMSADTSVTGRVTSVSIEDGRHGSVRVHPGKDGAVTIHRTVHYHDSAKPHPDQSLSDGSLTFSNGCDNCYIDYDLTVPATAKVSASNSSGAVDITGVAAVKVSTDSGEVTLDRIAGPVDVDSSSGAVHGAGLGKGAATANSSSGRIDLAFAERPNSVTTHSSSGAVELSVPGGPYAVTAHTSSGSRSVSVPTGSGPAISVTTSSGDVVVKPA